MVTWTWTWTWIWVFVLTTLSRSEKQSACIMFEIAYRLGPGERAMTWPALGGGRNLILLSRHLSLREIRKFQGDFVVGSRSSASSIDRATSALVLTLS